MDSLSREYREIAVVRSVQNRSDSNQVSIGDDRLYSVHSVLERFASSFKKASKSCPSARHLSWDAMSLVLASDEFIQNLDVPFT